MANVRRWFTAYFVSGAVMYINIKVSQSTKTIS